MLETFLFIKRGATGSLRSPSGRSSKWTLTEPPCFFYPTHPRRLMTVNPVHQNDPYLALKIKHTKKLISIFKATVLKWEASESDYPLLNEVKEQLARYKKMLADITGGLPCH